jgi:hypothetical protein
MAPKDIYDSKHWRNRATEMRALAESMSNSKPTLLLSDLADDYDKLADRAKSDGKGTGQLSERQALRASSEAPRRIVAVGTTGSTPGRLFALRSLPTRWSKDRRKCLPGFNQPALMSSVSKSGIEFDQSSLAGDASDRSIRHRLPLPQSYGDQRPQKPNCSFTLHSSKFILQRPNH